jgi:hypothetical protein
MKRIINCETGEVVERELTEEELAQQVEDEKVIATIEAETKAKAAARQDILDRLGLSEEEAKLLLG